ncbi:major facilitator superfamily domain-containing protein [Pterulicium gracile]|uniref:Major facilitator superfamily domain-containing protein n=1 Tax=Pterulicium gracile TaxID=1884261 RepID=A0A5C3QZH0_9AGAR|nr:major facilitator superfamily domain-containing protein [Pterula gracilis]
MSALTNDEEAPLLTKKPPTPLPWRQLLIILFLQLAEPLTSQVISPFTPQLIRDIGITNGDESKVGYYVGLMQSLFFLTQAFTVLHWSRLSDHIGRKPVILIGLLGLSISMFAFGLSKTFWSLVLSRALNGALNGNIGVIKSMMAEVTDPSNIALAYSYMPISWSTGSTVGPMIGGSLSHPAKQFPRLFGSFLFLKEYPYFLPCAIPATFSVIVWFVTYFYLEETLPYPKPILEYLGFHRRSSVKNTTPSATPPPQNNPPPLRSVLTKRVLLSAGNYATLSLMDIAFRSIQPLYLSTPITLGGLGFSPARIGLILSITGILNGIFQVAFFARIHNRFGSKRTFLVGVMSGFPAVLSLPVANYYARVDGGLSNRVWAILWVQVAVSVLTGLSYGSVFIFLTSAAPRSSLGAVNGLSQMTVSIVRAIGPSVANSMFSLSMEEPLPVIGANLVYVVLVGIVIMATAAGSLLPARAWNHD